MVSLVLKRRKSREFEEDDSDFEDLLADEDSASGDINLNDIAWSNDDDSEVEVPAFTEQVGPSVQLLFQVVIYTRLDNYNCEQYEQLRNGDNSRF